MNLNLKKTTALLSMCAFMAAPCFKSVPVVSATMLHTSVITEEVNQDNPFLSASTLPFEAPDFSIIRNEHFVPAFEAGMAQQLEQVEAIVSNPEAPTFENTIVAMEKTGEILTRVQRVFFNLTSAHTSPEIQQIQGVVSPKLATHSDNIMLNPRLFERVKTIYDKRESLDLDEESERLLENYYQRFLRSGALLNEEQMAQIREINSELSALSTTFQQNMLAITREIAVVVDDVEMLDGLSDSQIASAARLATDRGHDGKYMISITNTTRQPILTSLNNRELRQRVWEASAYRGLGKNGGIDNTEVILNIARLRAERAQLLGYGNWAEFALELQMAQNPETVLAMFTDLVPKVLENTMKEAEEIKAAMIREGKTHDLMPWDWEYYAEKVRKSKYDINENDIKPYFELESVLNNGVFYTMTRLYGITFEERFDIPVYHEDVRVWNVFDHDGEHIALFYGDFYARDSKRGGAWMSSFVGQSHLLDQKPVVVNVLNIPKPGEGEPTLVSLRNVVTLFHEMGHGIHGMFSDVKYPSLAGTSVSRDFVEFPSTFEEDWAITPEVLENYARHYQTGEPIPMDLLNRVIEAQQFNQGFDTFEYIAATLLDMEWHMLTPDQIPDNLETFEAYALAKHGVDYLPVPPRYKTAFFSHVWPGGYSANYYAYMWSEVLAADAFEFVQSRGGLDIEIGTFYRNTVLSRGGSRDPMQIYIDFRGQEPSVDALLRRRGLTVPDVN